MKKNSREEMIKSTAYLLQKNGYAGTGMNDIIQHSGAPKGSIYYHFPDGKEQLAIEAVLWTKQNVTVFIKERLSQYEDPSEAIQQFFLDSARRFEENNYFQGVPITAMILETSSTSEKLRAACLGVLEAWSKEFADKLFVNGYGKKEAKELGETCNMMIQGALVMSLASQDAAPLKTVAARIPLIIQGQ